MSTTARYAVLAVAALALAWMAWAVPLMADDQHCYEPQNYWDYEQPFCGRLWHGR